jgi:hypothetical protein
LETLSFGKLAGKTYSTRPFFEEEVHAAKFLDKKNISFTIARILNVKVRKLVKNLTSGLDFMKNCLFKLLFIVCISSFVNCSADCDCPRDEIRFIACPKTYVKPDQIQFHENGIFVQINDMIIETESLSTDTQGIFILTTRKRCGPSQWKCIRPIPSANGMPCETCNWTWNVTCYGCGERKNDRWTEK